MLNKDWCGRCERKIEAAQVRYVRPSAWEKCLKRRGWRWKNHRWICPDCLKAEAEERPVLELKHDGGP